MTILLTGTDSTAKTCHWFWSFPFTPWLNAQPLKHVPFQQGPVNVRPVCGVAYVIRFPWLPRHKSRPVKVLPPTGEERFPIAHFVPWELARMCANMIQNSHIALFFSISPAKEKRLNWQMETRNLGKCLTSWHASRAMFRVFIVFCYLWWTIETASKATKPPMVLPRDTSTDASTIADHISTRHVA